MTATTKTLSKAKSIIKSHNVDDIEQYVLINNFGFTFTYKNIKFDARYWVNCYGFVMNTWSVMPFGATFECANDSVRGDARRFAKELEKELNSILKTQ